MNINPCPFCGEHDVEYCEVEPGTFATDCPICQCIGPFADDTEGAAIAWNNAVSDLRRSLSVVTELLQQYEDKA